MNMRLLLFLVIQLEMCFCLAAFANLPNLRVEFFVLHLLDTHTGDQYGTMVISQSVSVQYTDVFIENRQGKDER